MEEADRRSGAVQAPGAGEGRSPGPGTDGWWPRAGGLGLMVKGCGFPLGVLKCPETDGRGGHADPGTN